MMHKHGRAFTVIERHACQRRLSELSQELTDLNPRSREDKLTRAELKVAVARVLDTMQRCDEILCPLPDPELSPIPAMLNLDAPSERQERMRLLLGALRDLPPSCVEAGKALRRALHAELKAPSAGRVNSKQQPRRNP